MPRVNLTCKCGWVFFVADTQMGKMVNCPSCGGAIRVPAPKGYRVMEGPPAQIAAEKEKQRKLLMMAGGLLVVILILVVAVAVMVSGEKKDDAAPGPSYVDTDKNAGGTNIFTKPVEEKKPGTGNGSGTGTNTSGTGGSSSGTNPGERIDYGRQIDKLIYQSNVAGVVCEILRLNGNAEMYDQLQKKMLDYESEMAACLRKLEEREESHMIPKHMEAGDRIAWFQSKNIEQMSKPDAVAFLKKSLAALRARDLWQVGVKRGNEVMEVYMYFGERPKELFALMNAVDVTPGREGGGGEEKTQPTVFLEIPSDVSRDIDAKIRKLPPYYFNCIPEEERTRMETLLKAKKGTADDIDFLKSRILGELYEQFMAEKMFFETKVKELAVKAVESTAVDVIYFKGGGKVEGQIIEETDDYVKIKSKIGAVKRDKADIERIERGKGSGSEFVPRYDAAKGKLDELVKLIAWCEEKKLPVQKEYLCYLVLTMDPANEAARKGLKYAKGDGGAWMTEADVKVSEGKIEWQGVLYTPEDLRKKLRQQGYVELNGLWYEKQPRSYKIDNLYRDEKKLVLTGNNISVDTLTESASGMVYDYKTRTWVKTSKNIVKARFIGPLIEAGNERFRTRRGTAFIQIDAPGEILECRIKAPSQVTEVGGVVTVSVVLTQNDESPHSMYTLANKGVNEAWYAVTDKVKGQRTFYIRAEMSSPWSDKNNAYVMWLPCDSNDTATLEVRYSVAKPLDRLNKVLGGGGTPKNGGGEKPPSDKDKAGNDDAYKKIDALASSIVKDYGTSCFDVMMKMRENTAGMKYTAAPELSAKFATCAKYVTDPLTFQTSDLTNAAAIEIGTWWKDLAADDRKAFARYFGLWCAHKRYTANK